MVWPPNGNILLIQDNSDDQYSSFRKRVPILMAVMLAHHLLTRALLFKYTRLMFSAAYCFILFGLSFLKILIILLVHYLVTKSIKRDLLPAFTWMFGICTFLLAVKFEGLRFGAIWDALEWMDDHGGIVRWQISANFLALRMISFSMDFYWYKTKKRVPLNPEIDGGEMTARQRIDTCLYGDDYNLHNYLTFALYAPLYIAGPIITFNDFVHQIKSKRTICKKSLLRYAARLLVSFLTMEVMMHLFYVVAIKDTMAWRGFSPLEIYTVGYLNLKFIWLKVLNLMQLLIIWRFFRLWALLDSVETVENMTKCMSNNYSAIGFWKNWHRSYNRWLIRYLYIPLGGKHYYAVNIFPIFTFVAIWHDTSLKLVSWGWLIALFILPEVVSTRLFCTVRVREYFGVWHVHFCAAGAVFNIVMMMMVNLVGFAVGLDGLKEIVLGLFDKGQGLALVSVLAGLFTGAHCMFWQKENEISFIKAVPG
jgi:D-alanyl-lipoteichoic acid acyltransferase DltB (MBOAT superfamily)